SSINPAFDERRTAISQSLQPVIRISCTDLSPAPVPSFQESDRYRAIALECLGHHCVFRDAAAFPDISFVAKYSLLISGSLRNDFPGAVEDDVSTVFPCFGKSGILHRMLNRISSASERTCPADPTFRKRAGVFDPETAFMTGVGVERSILGSAIPLRLENRNLDAAVAVLFSREIPTVGGDDLVSLPTLDTDPETVLSEKHCAFFWSDTRPDPPPMGALHL